MTIQTVKHVFFQTSPPAPHPPQRQPLMPVSCTYPSQSPCCMDKHVYISFIPPILPPVFKQMATYYAQYSVSVSSLVMSVGEVNDSS